LAGALRAGVRGSRSRVFASDAKVVSIQTGESAYPDVVVTYQPVQPAEDRITKPALIAEVLSRSTADYDRGAKFEMYKAFPMLLYYLYTCSRPATGGPLPAHNTRLELIHLGGDAAIDLAEIGCTIGLDAIYADAGC
jgi:hypothetical protein